ncbi:MAG: serine hydrolase, partial [Gammaproteobacteria bacterium]|nr:beta-lactamase family protein [Gemmatimonadota bacterium]NIU76654.1 serine hydrolase [Gammaproteobacteria bacterium]
AEWGSGQAAAPWTAAIDSAEVILESFMAERGIPGLSAAVAVDGELVWTEGFGYANLQHMVEATPETRWRIASISKPFAALNAYQLAAEGRLDLD